MTAQTDVSFTPTTPVLRIARLGTRRLTRAHLSLQRTALKEIAAAALAPVAAAVGEQIAAELRIEARLLDGSFLPKQTLPRTSGFAVFELSAADSAAVLEVDLPFLVATLGRVAGTPGRPGLVTRFTRIEEAAFGLVALVMLNALRRHGLLETEFAPRLTALTTDRAEVLGRIDERQAHLAIEVKLALGDETGVARVLVPARCIQVVAERFPPANPPQTLPAPIAAARLRARLFCGRSPLASDELSRLQPGDVVLFEDLRITAGQVHGSARLSTPLFDLLGELTPTGFNARRGSPRGFPPESAMSQPPQSPPAELIPPLPIEVEVELTRVHLPVSELANLRAGSLIPLHVNSSEPVVLRIGDRAVARAELVEIEGEVGARILSLLP